MSNFMEYHEIKGELAKAGKTWHSWDFMIARILLMILHTLLEIKNK